MRLGQVVPGAANTTTPSNTFRIGYYKENFYTVRF